jgi:hypothetical protein
MGRTNIGVAELRQVRDLSTPRLTSLVASEKSIRFPHGIRQALQGSSIIRKPVFASVIRTIRDALAAM